MIDELSSKDDLIRQIYTLRQRNHELESYQSGINLEAYRNLHGVRLLESINKLFCASITIETEEEISSIGLKMAMELTNSRMGFIALVNNKGRLRILAVDGLSWDASSRSDVAGARNAYPELGAYGLYGKIIIDGNALLTNNPHLHMDSIRIPPGHPVINSFLGAPLIEDGKTVGVVALANCEGGYAEEDLNYLQAFVPTYLQLLLHTRFKKALREREKYFRALVTTGSEGIYRMNSDWSELLQLNTTGLFGSIDKPKRDWLQRYIPPDDQLLVIDRINEAIMTKGTFELEHKVRQAGNSPRWVFSRAIPLMNKKGEIIEWFGTTNDITERKKAEKALLESEHLYRTLFDNTEDGFALIEPIFDEDGESDNYLILEVNKAWQRQTKLKASDIIGYCIRDVMPHVASRWPSMFGQVARTGKSTHIESYNSKSGRWHDLYSFRYREGQVGVLMRDITERKKVEAALRQSEERFRKTFHASPIMASIINAKDGAFIDVNDAWLKVMGYERDEIIGKLSFNFDHNYANFERRMKVIESLRSKGQSIVVEGILHTRNGEQRNGIFSSEIIEINGTTCVLNQIVDITERKSAEEKLHRLDRLNLVGEMAASIGHEIRNPMTAIRGFLQILQQKECYSEDREFFDLMLEELDRANGIITEYLGMARDKKIELQTTDLNQVVEKLYPMIQADANYQGITVQLNLGQLPSILLDKSEIRQLILNLARNGMDAMPSGGVLTIGTRADKNETILFVSDDGPGVDAEIINKLGTPFVTTKENGTGLGLPVCYSIAARHNARLEVETGPQGTTFMLKFPVQSSLRDIRNQENS